MDSRPFPAEVNAQTVRGALKSAGIDHLIVKIRTGRDLLKIDVVWNDDTAEALRLCNLMVDALRPFWNDGNIRVFVLAHRTVCVRRERWDRTVPQAALNRAWDEAHAEYVVRAVAAHDSEDLPPRVREAEDRRRFRGLIEQSSIGQGLRRLAEHGADREADLVSEELRSKRHVVAEGYDFVRGGVSRQYSDGTIENSLEPKIPAVGTLLRYKDSTPRYVVLCSHDEYVMTGPDGTMRLRKRRDDDGVWYRHGLLAVEFGGHKRHELQERLQESGTARRDPLMSWALDYGQLAVDLVEQADGVAVGVERREDLHLTLVRLDMLTEIDELNALES